MFQMSWSIFAWGIFLGNGQLPWEAVEKKIIRRLVQRFFQEKQRKFRFFVTELSTYVHIFERCKTERKNRLTFCAKPVFNIGFDTGIAFPSPHMQTQYVLQLHEHFYEKWFLNQFRTAGQHKLRVLFLHEIFVEFLDITDRILFRTKLLWYLLPTLDFLAELRFKTISWQKSSGDL